MRAGLPMVFGALGEGKFRINFALTKTRSVAARAGAVAVPRARLHCFSIRRSANRTLFN